MRRSAIRGAARCASGATRGRTRARVRPLERRTTDMTSTQAHSPEAPPTCTESLLTHIALPVRDLEATLAFYEKYTKLVNIHERQDPETGLRTAWLANESDITQQGARFVIVLIHGKLPTKITGDIKEQYGFLKSISHLGISVESRAEVDRLAEVAREEGGLRVRPM